MKKINVVAAVITNGDKIYSTQRGYGEFKGGWEFPGGKIEPGETGEQAVIREIKEELNVEIKVIRKLGMVDHQYPTFEINLYFYLCKIISGKPYLNEHEDAKWLDKNSLYSVDWLEADLKMMPHIEECML